MSTLAFVCWLPLPGGGVYVQAGICSLFLGKGWDASLHCGCWDWVICIPGQSNIAEWKTNMVWLKGMVSATWYISTLTWCWISTRICSEQVSHWLVSWPSAFVPFCSAFWGAMTCPATRWQPLACYPVCIEKRTMPKVCLYIGRRVSVWKKWYIDH